MYQFKYNKTEALNFPCSSSSYLVESKDLPNKKGYL